MYSWHKRMQKHIKLLTHDGQITGVSLVESFTFFFNNSRTVEKSLMFSLVTQYQEQKEES